MRSLYARVYGAILLLTEEMGKKQHHVPNNHGLPLVVADLLRAYIFINIAIGAYTSSLLMIDLAKRTKKKEDKLFYQFGCRLFRNKSETELWFIRCVLFFLLPSLLVVLGVYILHWIYRFIKWIWWLGIKKSERHKYRLW